MIVGAQDHPLTDKQDKMWKALVPGVGKATSTIGEVVRAIDRLGYEYHNNGNCNAVESIEEHCHCGYDEDCWECGGEGIIEGCNKINSFYKYFIDTLEEYTGLRDEAQALTAFIEEHNMECKFNQREADIYNALFEPAINKAWDEYEKFLKFKDSRTILIGYEKTFNTILKDYEFKD